MTVEGILAQRQKTHGDFKSHAELSQALKHIVCLRRYKLTVSQMEALEMICHKIARILNGDPDHKDHWDDIAGYATLVSKQLESA